MVERRQQDSQHDKRGRGSGWAIVALVVLAVSQRAVADDIRLEVYPPQFRLDGPRARMQLVVTGVAADGSVQDLTREATLASSDERVVRLVPTPPGPPFGRGGDAT
ncbi:MAG: hypothetical protein HYS13_13250, partial [Planctomycetia bacterium]|nr:hypothetical protein [Planctomycetia bacterium]